MRYLVIDKATATVVNVIEHDPVAHPDFVRHDNLEIIGREDVHEIEHVQQEVNTGLLDEHEQPILRHERIERRKKIGERNQLRVVERVIMVASDVGEIGWRWDGARAVDPNPPQQSAPRVSPSQPAMAGKPRVIE